MVLISDTLPICTKHIDVRGRRVLVRVDFNVPAEDGNIVDDFRIKKTLPLLQMLYKEGAHVILLSHLTEKKEHRSFEPLRKELSRVCGVDIQLFSTPEALGAAVKSARSWHLLENLRIFPEEVEGSEAFARRLAACGDLYVNEDFSQSHRPYASIVHLPHVLPSYAGPLFVQEVEKLEEAFDPPHPFLLILGGIKFATKVGVLDHMLEKADTVLVGGALANTFLVAQGHSVGASPVEEGMLADIKRRYVYHTKIILPADVRVDGKEVRTVDAIEMHEHIYDAGPRTLEVIKQYARRAKFILWNGPLGFMEKGYKEGTEDLLRVLQYTDAKVIIGGGDTLAAVHRRGLEGAFHHLSTGGGAMLEFLARGTLPGIEALLNAKR